MNRKQTSIGLFTAMLVGCINLDLTRNTARFVRQIGGDEVHEFLRQEQGPAVRLKDGRVFALSVPDFAREKFPDMRAHCSFPNPSPYCAIQVQPKLAEFVLTPLPSKVDLTQYQTLPMRDQGGRDTCQTFGVVAAIEAAYKRGYGLDLDLSEQYLKHVHMMGLLNPAAILPNNEVLAGSIGGRNPIEVLSVLLKGYGLPLEFTVPYVAAADYQNPNAGDDPDIMNWSLSYPQFNIDTW